VRTDDNTVQVGLAHQSLEERVGITQEEFVNDFLVCHESVAPVRKHASANMGLNMQPNSKSQA
jgi:hypothetical protein